jgi:propionate CoA-transferase
VPHRKAWKFLTLESKMPVAEGAARVAYVNRLLGITPLRAPADLALARLAAWLFARHAFPGMSVDVGVGLPEQVAHVLADCGLTDQLITMNESGVFGGQAAPGIFFGAAVNPTEIVSSAEAFRRIYANLDSVVLGVLEADSDGNVNVSRRGEGAINYVGPGGFIDLTTCAKLVVFCGSWMAHGKVELQEGQMRVLKAGTPKFIEQVSEVTFNGREALRRGQQVYYITHVGAFELTEAGMLLRYVMPGIDLERHILQFSPMRIVLPEGGPEQVPPEVVTGKGLCLKLGQAARPALAGASVSAD